ncbi:MAG: ADOP family duplicated permease [Gemmatimonadaceae bacterium]
MRYLTSRITRRCRSCFQWIRALLTRRARERDLAEELQLHLEQETERNLLHGMSPADARAAAHRLFGNVELLKDQSRDARGTRWLDEFRQDARYALRDIARRPTFATLVIATLAVGIGVNSAAFSVLNLLFQPMAVPDAPSVVALEVKGTARRYRDSFSYDDLRLLRANTPSLRAIAGSSGPIPVIFSRRIAQSVPRDAFASFVTDEYFSLLGGNMVLGRGILASDNLSENASPVAVLSGRFWRTEFGGDSAVIGQSVTVSGVTFQVVGVAEETFAGEGFELQTPEVWVPAMMRRAIWRDQDSTSTSSNIPWLDLTARLSPGSSLPRAKLELASLNRQIAKLHDVPDSVVRLGAYRPGALGKVTLAERSGALSIGMLAPLLILLIACANLTNVMLTRAAARQHEIGVRLSLGAGRARIVRQLLVESAVLAFAGAAAGLLITRVLISVLAVRLFESFGHRDPVTAASRIVVDAHVMGVTLLVAIGTVFVVGLLPALRATRLDLTSVLKGASGGATGGASAKSRLRNSLVVVQVACSAVLLLVAGSFAQSVSRTADADVGFDASHIVVSKTYPTMTNGDSARAHEVRRAIAERLHLMPAITEIAETSQVPFEGIMITGVARTDALPSTRGTSTLYMQVSSNFFSVLEIPIAGGRTFGRGEGIPKPEVVMVSEALAKALWPGESAIGKQLKSEFTANGATVVGIVRDVSLSSPGERTMPVLYAPLLMNGNVMGESGVLLAKTTGNTDAVANAVRNTIRSYDPTLYASVYTMSAAIDKSEFVRAGRSFATGASALGSLALLLAAVGLYGVAAFAVAQRTREIGIRMALGANRSQVLRESLLRIGRLAMVGVMFGAVGGTIVLLVLRALLSGLAPFSAVAFAGVIVLLMVTSLLAAWVPSRRASRIDPMSALRS